jgi:hypothetical protein
MPINEITVSILEENSVSSFGVKGSALKIFILFLPPPQKMAQ